MLLLRLTFGSFILSSPLLLVLYAFDTPRRGQKILPSLLLRQSYMVVLYVIALD